ncbi:STAM-binding protein [Holothuria leucospilota]|uniref:STAM-binding protein n=1 Tax=Holothuria leucospilota TaxID=206669 RepID=A0A9Q0YPQ0_HOLLE|nr:STAM-binding protein [Holothuria leucospilota]
MSTATQQVSEPAARVRILAEKGADMVSVDENIPIKRYLRSGKEMIKMANVYFDEKDWERSFLLYNKYITLFVEKLPKQHPDYSQIRHEDKKESRKMIKAAFPRAEETKIKVMEKYQVEYDAWCAAEKLRLEKEAQLKEEARRKEEEERLEREREAALGEEERQRRREERERQVLEEQQRILEEQKTAVLEEKRREQLLMEEERRRLAEEEQKRINAAVAPAVQDRNHVEAETGTAYVRPTAPAVDRSLKVDRSSKPSHLIDSSPLPALRKTNKYGFRTVMVPDDATVRFMQLAEPYTSRNVEFCGILAGKLAQHAFTITHIVIPKQEGTSDSCTALNEEDMFDVMDNNDLITLGWIHTHPSQTAFLSSIDLHTHCPYQIMLPEAIAIVCAPKHKEIGFFSLTPDHGLKFVSKCTKKGFHEHPKHPPLFESSDHCTLVNTLKVHIVDLR